MAASTKVNVVLLAFFFSGLMQMSAAAADGGRSRGIDGKAVDQAIAYLLMLVALFVTYFAH